jgi:hypothetical protein
MGRETRCCPPSNIRAYANSRLVGLRALEGKIRPHHRFLPFCSGVYLINLRFVQHEIVLLDECLEDIGRERPELPQAVARWDTIPGIDRLAG